MASLPLVERGHGVADVVASEDGSPWERLGLYEKQVKAHLEGSQAQLRRLSEVKVDALRSRVGSESRETFELLSHERDLRSNLAQKIQDLRNGIESLAMLIVEIQRHRQNGDEELVTECYAELQQTAQSVRDNFQGQRKFFLDTLTRQEADTVAHSKDAHAASSDIWFYGGLGCLMVCVNSGVWASFFRDSRPGSSNVESSLMRAFLDWFLGLISKQEHGFPKSAIVWYPAVPVVTTASFFWSLRKFFLAHVRYRGCRQLKRQACDNTGLVRANEEMWTGMNQLVDALSEKVKYFHGLNKRREDRVQQTLTALVDKMFNMVMSVDVYMVWMERHNMFPPNVSVSVMMGGPKYQAIYSMLNPKRGWLALAARSS